MRRYWNDHSRNPFIKYDRQGIPFVTVLEDLKS